MIWTFILANLKYILLGLFGAVGAFILKENGRVKEEIKHTKGENKKLLEQRQFQVSQFKRAEFQAKKAKEFSDALEKKLMETDPSSLSTLKLDIMSSQPIYYTDLSSSSGEHKTPSEDEDGER